MEYKEIKEKLFEIILDELCLNPKEKIDCETSLLEIGIDSIEMMALLVSIEEKFDFEVDEDVLIEEPFLKIGDIVAYIYSKKVGGSNENY